MTPDDRDQRMERLREGVSRQLCDALDLEPDEPIAEQCSFGLDGPMWTLVAIHLDIFLAAHDQAKAAERSGG